MGDACSVCDGDDGIWCVGGGSRLISASSGRHYGQHGWAVHGSSDPETRCRWFARRVVPPPPSTTTQATTLRDEHSERRISRWPILNAGTGTSAVLCIWLGFLLVKLTLSCARSCDTSIRTSIRMAAAFADVPDGEIVKVTTSAVELSLRACTAQRKRFNISQWGQRRERFHTPET